MAFSIRRIVRRRPVRRAVTNLALGLVLEFFLFLLLLRQFFLTLFVSVVGCSQNVLSSYWGHFTISHSEAGAHTAFSASGARRRQGLLQIGLQVCHSFQTD